MESIYFTRTASPQARCCSPSPPAACSNSNSTAASAPKATTKPGRNPLTPSLPGSANSTNISTAIARASPSHWTCAATDFQLQCWRALLDIPYGETRTYRDIAHAIAHPHAFRAVGMSNNRNPIAIVVPCHRVIASDGSLCGYGGGLDIKRKLLDLENGHLRPCLPLGIGA